MSGQATLDDEPARDQPSTGPIMSAIIRAAFDFRRQVREQFQDLLEARYAAAVHDCNTVLLNARGREARIDPFTLFYGPAARVDAYASHELREWFATHGRQTFAQFEQQYVELGPAAEPPDDATWSAAS